MLFTSGTAGSPKAAMLSHNNLSSNQLAMIASPDSGYEPGAVFLASLPLSHIFGLNVAFMTAPREARATSASGNDDESGVVIEVGGDDVATEPVAEDNVDGIEDDEVADDGPAPDEPGPSGLWLVGALVAIGVVIGTIVATRSSREESDDDD